MKSLIWKLSSGSNTSSPDNPVGCLEGLINFGFIHKASDIHIDVVENLSYFKIRINGEILYYAYSDRFLYLGILGVIKSRSNLRIDIHDRGQDGSFVHLPYKNRTDIKVFVRVSISPTFYGESVVLRLLDQKYDESKSLDNIGVNNKLLGLIKKYTDLENSLILISGSTGSGKTTTMYSIVNFLKPESIVVISLEDPVEKNIPNVRQVPIRPDIGFSYADGLRIALRQDPDVIVIGEIRDRETAEIAIEASLTGHVIIAGIHARDCVDVIYRLINLGIDEFLITQTLSISIHQKMIYPENSNNERNKTYVDFKYIDLFKYFHEKTKTNLIKNNVMSLANPASMFALKKMIKHGTK